MKNSTNILSKAAHIVLEKKDKPIKKEKQVLNDTN
jgi:hypothetical protein